MDGLHATFPAQTVAKNVFGHATNCAPGALDRLRFIRTVRKRLPASNRRLRIWTGSADPAFAPLPDRMQALTGSLSGVSRGNLPPVGSFAPP